MLRRILVALLLPVCLLASAARLEAEDDEEDEARTPAAVEPNGYYAIAILAGPTQVYSKKYRTYVETLLNKETGTYLSSYFRFQYQPDGTVRHLAVDVELQSLSAKEKESYDGGDVAVSYDSGALVGGLRYFVRPQQEGWDRMAISLGVNGGFASSRIKVSSPTGEFEFEDSNEIIAGLVGGVLYRVAMGFFVAGDLYVGARASLVGGFGYAF